jgi:hypothetical protein
MVAQNQQRGRASVRESVSSGRDINWRVSRMCDGGACIGVARRGESVLIGNADGSGDIAGEFTLNEWSQFVAGVKLGDFDELT